MHLLKIGPWLRLFRLPHLPTAPGDALVGAAFMLPAGEATLTQAFAAAVGALFMYMFGLADNDVVGAYDDAEKAPERPIPRGEISMNVAAAVGIACLFASIWLPELVMRIVNDGGEMPMAWNIALTVLCGTVLAYNRIKKAWLLGACRALSVVCGGLAVWAPDRNPYTGRLLPESCCLLASLVLLAVGWGAYMAAVAKLSDGEERPSEGLGNRRFLLGLSAFVPLAGFLPFACVSGVAYESGLVFVLPVTGCCCTFVAWCLAVEPLWLPHGPDVRRRAVGRAIGALLYMQTGFMLIVARPAFLVAAAGLWCASRLVGRWAPHVSGS